MSITFTGRFAPSSETFGINFQAMVNDRNVVCVITPEALQDISRSTARSAPGAQYQFNRDKFEEVAREKIEVGAYEDGKIWIRSEDVC